MTKEEWGQLCMQVAIDHPDWVHETFMAFSSGVAIQAGQNRDMVANFACSLAMLYEQPRSPKARKLARERMIESKCFGGTPFEKKLKESK